MTKTIRAVADRADFGPAYDGEDYITLTFRVPKDTGAIPGIWDLTPVRPGTLDWAKTKDEAAEMRREMDDVKDMQTWPEDIRRLHGIRSR
jgi:hypothetical protein